MAWVVKRMPAELRRGCEEKRMRGWRKMLAQTVAVSCGVGVSWGCLGGGGRDERSRCRLELLLRCLCFRSQ